LEDLVAEYGCPSGLPPISAVFDTTLTDTQVCALVTASVEKAAPLLAPGDSIAHVQVRSMAHVDSRDVVLQSWWMVTLAIPRADRDIEVLFDVTTGAPEARFVPKTR
jgi:hypothetical protein